MAASASNVIPLGDRDIWERDRLAALQKFDVLDSPREEAFDRITRLIRNIFDVEIGIVSVIDAHRQWYKSVEGLDTTEAARSETFCRFPLMSGQPVVVEDATKDSRFADNPHVTAERGIRFYAGVPLRTNDGHTIGTLCAVDYKPRKFSDRDVRTLEDLSLIAMNELELRQRTTVDVLTGVLSRRAFKDEGARATSLATRHAHSLGCIVFDLDHFKNVNDTHGHAAGDKVLVAVAKACVALLRSSDLLGRLGGEEFAVLLPHTGQKEAIEVAEKLRLAIAALQFDFGTGPVSITASFGIAAAELKPVNIDTLLERADKALYEAKAAGRNVCVGYDTPGSEPKVAPRRVLKAGRIIFNNHSSSIDCTVRQLSEEGARLDVTSTIGIPPTFTLSIRMDRFESRCRIVGQTERHLDVAFC